MHENEKIQQQESETAFAVASLLLNLLILLVLCGSVWLIHMLLTQSNGFDILFRDIALR